MVKCFIIFLSLLNILFGNELITQSKLFPYFLMYDKELKDKTIDNTINFLIVYDEFSKESAFKLKESIIKEHGFKINEYKLNTILAENLTIDDLKIATAIYIFDIDDKYVKIITNFAKKHKLITFANKSAMLKKDIVVALSIKKRVQPLINLKVLKSSNIKLSYKIFKVSKIYE